MATTGDPWWTLPSKMIDDMENDIFEGEYKAMWRPIVDSGTTDSTPTATDVINTDTALVSYELFMFTADGKKLVSVIFWPSVPPTIRIPTLESPYIMDNVTSADNLNEADKAIELVEVKHREFVLKTDHETGNETGMWCYYERE